MSKIIKTKLRFDGEYLKEHAIDIDVLAPSLLGLSSLIQNANALINGDKAKVTVKVNAAVEQNCFEVLLICDFKLLEQFRDLLDPKLKDIKEILTWIGLLGGPTIIGTLFWLIKKFRGKKIPQEEILSSGKETTTIKGDNNQPIVIKNSIIKLYQDRKILENAHSLLRPLENEGIDTLETGEKEAANILHKEDYLPFLREGLSHLTKPTQKNITTRHLVVHSPVLKVDASKWDFTIDGAIRTVDISNTDIAAKAMQRGEVREGDTYKVELEEQEYKTPTGQYRTKYKIIKVLRFERGSYTTPQNTAEEK